MGKLVSLKDKSTIKQKGGTHLLYLKVFTFKYFSVKKNEIICYRNA